MNRTTLTRWWLSVTVAFLVQIPYVTRFTTKAVRLEYSWSRADSAALLLGLLLSGTALFLAHSLLRRWVPAACRFPLTFFLVGVLLACVSSKLYFMSFVRQAALHESIRPLIAPVVGPVSLLWLIRIEKWFVLGVLAVLTVGHRERLAAWGQAALAMFSPTIPVFFASLLLTSAPPRALGAGAASPARTSRPVVFIVSDELSYDRTFVGARVLADMPALRGIAERSFVFHDAVSSGGSTHVALAGLLGGAVVPAVIPGQLERLDAVFPDGSVFSDASAAGLRCYVVGWALPYVRWFPGLDGAWVSSANRMMGARFSHRVFEAVVQGNLADAAPVWLKRLRDRIDDPARRHWSNAQTFQRHVLRQLKDARRPFLLFIHYPVPHGPYIGALRQDGRAASYAGAERYMGNVFLFDDLLGELVEALEAAGLWDDSMLIITSDHSWREDPRYRDRLRVPLLVKLPRQRTSVDIRRRFETRQVRGLLRAFTDGDIADERRLSRWLQRSL